LDLVGVASHDELYLMGMPESVSRRFLDDRFLVDLLLWLYDPPALYEEAIHLIVCQKGFRVEEVL